MVCDLWELFGESILEGLSAQKAGEEWGALFPFLFFSINKPVYRLLPLNAIGLVSSSRVLCSLYNYIAALDFKVIHIFYK